MGLNSNQAFQKKFGAASTFVAGTKRPEEILIVGVDEPLDETNQDLWDEARLAFARNHPIDPLSLISTLDAGGSIPAVEVVFRGGKVYGGEGRRRIFGARAANLILAKNGAKADELIELRIIPMAGADVAVSVRLGNEGRLEDPPYVKAQNAARLRGRGKSDEVLARIFNVETQTIGHWFNYLDLDLTIRAQVETEGLPKDQRVPFAVGIDLGKMGPEKHGAQRLVLAYLRKTGAPITGERGRENVRNTIKAVIAGEITEATLDQAVAQEPVPEDGAPPVVAPHSINLATGEGSGPIGAQPNPPAQVQAPKPAQPGAVVLNLGKLSWNAIREAHARLEPTKDKPLKSAAAREVYAILSVIVGQDPAGSTLTDPEVLAAIKPLLRSGPAQVTAPVQAAAPKPPPVVKPTEYNVQTDAIRSLACPNPRCDKGVDKSGKAKTCLTCQGYGKISPSRARDLKGKK